MSNNRWSNRADKEKMEYDNGGYGGERDGGSENRYDSRSAGSNADGHSRRGKRSSADDLAEWIQDMVQDAVDSMDFSNLSQNIRDAVDTARDAVGSARETMAEQMKEKSRKSGKAERQRYGKHYRWPDDSRVQQPVESRQPREKGWLRRIPGRWSGPARTVTGACGMIVFGALSLGFGLAGLGFSMTNGILSTATIVLESVFIPLTVVSGVLFGTGRAAGSRVRRLREYAGLWGEKGFIMLQDLKNGTGYAMKRIQKDIRFLLDNHLIPYARMDENKTCLMLTREAGEQYDAAVRSRIEREQREARQKAGDQAVPGTAGDGWNGGAGGQKPGPWTADGQVGQDGSAQTDGSGQNAAAQKRPEEMTEEERKMYRLQQTGGSYLQELRERKARIQTPEVSEKLDRLELLLSRIFVCIREYPENISQADRLLEYYLPSVMKLVRVYEDMEKQPIQSVNIIKTRMEIAESLDTVNQALEAMYDDMFQDVAMDISSDIKVLETMLAKDGWGAQELRSQREPESSIWDERG